MNAGHGGSAVNNAVCQLRIPQNLAAGPENRVFDLGSFFDSAICSNPGIGDFGRRGDLSIRVDFGRHGEAGFEVGLAGAEIEPLRASLDVVGSEFAPFDEFEEGGNDGDFLVCWDEVEDFGIDAIDSGELVSASLSVHLAANVGDFVTIEGEMKGWAVILSCKGGDIVGGHVAGHETVDGEIGDDVTIVNEDGVSIDPLRDVLNASSGFEKNGFVKKGEFCTAISSIGESLAPGLVKMMGVDGKISDPGGDAVIKDMGHEGAIGKGDEGFGKSVGEGLQAGAETCSKKKSFAHGLRMI